MNDDEAALFAMTLEALQSSNGGASCGLVEDAEPMTATCNVEYSDK